MRCSATSGPWASCCSCFDQVTADQVRAEAEVLFSHAPTLAIAGARVPARRIESVLSRW